MFEGVDGIYKRAYSLVSTGEEPPKAWYEELEEQVCSVFPKLSLQQRLSGCLLCMIVGFLISMGSTFRIVKLLEGDPEPFAVMYSIGNLLGLFSTCFLYGPVSQVKQMFAMTRLIASLVYLLLLALTLFLAFYSGDIPGRVALLVLAVFFQFLALIWYTLSYVPFARQAVGWCLGSYCGSCCAGAGAGGSGSEGADVGWV